MTDAPAEPIGPDPLPTDELLEEVVILQEHLLEALGEAFDHLQEAAGVDHATLGERLGRDPAWVEERLTGERSVSLVDMVQLAAAMDCSWEFRLRLGRVGNCPCDECVERRRGRLEVAAEEALRMIPPAGRG